MRFRPLSVHLKAGLLALTVGLLGPAAWAQERWLLVSPFPPGGPVDSGTGSSRVAVPRNAYANSSGSCAPPPSRQVATPTPLR